MEEECIRQICMVCPSEGGTG